MSTDQLHPAGPKRTPLVLRTWYTKMLYVIVGVGIYYFVAGLVPSDNLRGILRSVLVFVLFVLGARIFRSAGEVGNEPRPWWRMTGRPFAGWVIGVVFGVAALALLTYAIGITTSPSARKLVGQEPVVAATLVLFALLAILYLTSSVRLRAIEREARIREQRSDNGNDTPYDGTRKRAGQ